MVLLVLVSACGDPIDRASNGTELEAAERQAIGEAAANAALSPVITEIRERVNERAREMAGEALARGADAEAELCTSLSQ
jgi:F0F1-type ATP synthase membrane subunit b/b'